MIGKRIKGKPIRYGKNLAVEYILSFGFISNFYGRAQKINKYVGT